MTCAEFARWLYDGMLDVDAAAAQRAPADFTASVMARVHVLGSAHVAPAVEPLSARGWIRLLSDPITTVSITVSLLALGLLIWNPAWLLRFGGWLGSLWLAGFARAGTISLSPTWGLALLATLMPFALWSVWQIVRRLERAMVLQMTRPGG